ncbi:two-component regulator propeller domain-containing protein, partial [Desulfosarcina cetonica]
MRKTKYLLFNILFKIFKFLTIIFISANYGLALECNFPPFLEIDCIEHEILKKEIISTIANKYYGTLQEKPVSKILLDFNEIKDETKILVGTRIKIPKIHGLNFPEDKIINKIRIDPSEKKYLSLMDALGYCSDQPATQFDIPIIDNFESSKVQLFSTVDGLPANGTLCVDQDREGNLWIGTFSGVSRFNGSTFKNYGRKEGFVNDYVWAILGDKDGNIWAGTQRHGLFQFSNDKWNQCKGYSPYNNLQNFEDGFIFQDNKGCIWGGGYSIDFFKIYQNYLIPISFNDRNIRIQDVAENDYDNHLYAIEAYQLSSNNNECNFADINKSIKLLKIAETDSSTNESIVNIGEPYLKLKGMPKGIAFNQNRKIYILEDKNLTCSFLNSNYSWPAKQFNKAIEILPESTARHIMVDLNDYVWIAYHDYFIRFKEKHEIKVYGHLHGLPEGRYYYVFQDRTGHIWFCSKNGLAKYDNIPPKIELVDEIPKFIKTSNFSFRITGNDGDLGSPQEDIIYKYKLIRNQNHGKWIIAENGNVNLNNLQENVKYTILVQAIDGFQNVTEIQHSFKVGIDYNSPTVTITNQEDFLHPLKTNSFSFKISGRDDLTQQTDLLYRYKLEKKYEKETEWPNQWNKEVKEVLFENIISGEYTFQIQVRNRLGNISLNKINFTVAATADRPKIALESLFNCYYNENNNKPILHCSPISDSKELFSGRIKFIVRNIDNRQEKKELQYAVQLNP